MTYDICNSSGSRRTALLVLVACVALPGLAGAQSLPRQRAGEWVTQIEGGRTVRGCLHEDLVMDQATVMRRFSRMKGAQCTLADVHTVGPVTNYAITCVINGTMHMTSHETMTMLAPDTYQTKSFVHMDQGQMHDMTTVTTTHRTGAGQPGDANF